MASKTVTCSGTSGGKYNLTLTYWTNSQDIAGNKSNIYVEATLKRNDGYAGSFWDLYESHNSAYIKVGGSTKVSRNLKIDTRNGATVTLASWSGDVSHNVDGSLTVALEAGFDTTSGSLSGGTVSASYTLATIPRRSDFSLSATAIDAGQSVTVTISPASGSYTHKVIYTWGSNSHTATLTTGTTSTYTVPLSWLTAIPNSVSGSMSVAVQTLSGSTALGTVTKHVTVRCPSTVIPTISNLTATRIDNDVPSSWGVYVKDHSQAKITINGAAGVYGSTIKSYRITSAYYSSVLSTLTTQKLSYTGQITFTGVVTDSRGRSSTSKMVSITVQDYDNPTLALTDVYRCNADGAANDGGNYLSVKPTWGISSVGGKNAGSCTYVIKRTDGSGQQTGNLPSGTATVISGVSSDYTYNLTVTVTDGITSVSTSQSVPTAAVIMSWRQGGTGMAVGKVSERDGFEVGWHAYFTGGVETNNIKVAALSGLLKASNGTVSAAVAGTDYATQASVDAKQNKITSSGILKGNGSGGVSAATAGTDYVSGAQAAAKESCILLRVTADQSVPANTDTVINWSLYDSKGNQLEFYPGNKRIVVKSSYITSVTVCATVCNDWDDNSNHHVYIKKNGEIILAALNDGPAVTACISIPVTTGDYIEITVYYTTAGAIKSANRTVASVQAH